VASSPISLVRTGLSELVIKFGPTRSLYQNIQCERIAAYWNTSSMLITCPAKCLLQRPLWLILRGKSVCGPGGGRSGWHGLLWLPGPFFVGAHRHPQNALGTSSWRMGPAHPAMGYCALVKFHC